MVQSEVADINRQTGESECRYYKDRLLFSEEAQRDGLIDRSKTISCHGELKNHRGLVSRSLLLHPPPHLRTRPTVNKYLHEITYSVFITSQFFSLQE